jgi:O-antigen ligase
VREFKHRVIPVTTRLLFVYVAFVFVGCLASPLGPKNMFRWIQGVLIILAVFYGISLGLGRKLLAVTFAASFVNVALTVASGKSEVLDGVATGRLAGYMQPNHLAFTCAVVIIGAVWLWMPRPKWRPGLAFAIVLSSYALLASHSRTALLALIAAMVAGIGAAFIGPTRRGRAAAWTLVAVLLLAPVVVPVFGTWFNRDDSTQSITSLTGRTDFWPLAVDLIEQRPVVGWGVNVILSPVGYKFQLVLPGVGQAHNAYLEAALQGGIPGVLAWGGALLGVVLGSFRLPRSDPYRFLLIANGILVEFFALTESSPAWFGDMFIIYVLAIAVYGERYARAHRKDGLSRSALTEVSAQPEPEDLLAIA